MNKRTCFSIFLLTFICGSYLNSQQSENVRLDQMFIEEKVKCNALALAAIAINVESDNRCYYESDRGRCVRYVDYAEDKTYDIQLGSNYCFNTYATSYNHTTDKNLRSSNNGKFTVVLRS